MCSAHAAVIMCGLVVAEITPPSVLNIRSKCSQTGTTVFRLALMLATLERGARISSSARMTIVADVFRLVQAAHSWLLIGYITPFRDVEACESYHQN